MQEPNIPFNLEQFKAGRHALTGGGKVAKFITYVTELGAAYPLIVQVGDEVRRYNQYGDYGCSAVENLERMQVERVGFDVRIAIGDDGQPYIKSVIERPFIPIMGGAEREVSINGFK